MATPAAKIAIKKNLSGQNWWTANQGKPAFSNSTSIDKLDATFQANIKAFKKALEDAGASIQISTTRRSENRAYVMHWAWKVAKGLVTADKVPAKTGVDITWDHGNAVASKKGAQEIVTAARIAYQPSLTSNHIKGKAIDWTITWTGDLKIKNKLGKEVVIKSMPKHGGQGQSHNGNTELHAVGKTYGVVKAKFTKIDGPHWSVDGK
ncbi:MAG: hypothetical protein OEY52_15720 [Gammaproteobacteria bacterium]|nr:hypothetical protein [Gammaproteobacteria bacterium]